MKGQLVTTALVLVSAALSAAPKPIRDGVGLNIGISCQWQSACMEQQRNAMHRSLDYVARSQPPHWRIQLCNRNAGKGAGRVDWVGYDHCIRNLELKPALTRGKHHSP
jgi:hypothetical protein